MNYNHTPHPQQATFCQYHPVVNAGYFCPTCQHGLCDDCCNNDNQTHKNLCYLCHTELEIVEQRNTILPFWRRLQQSFRYPLDTNAVILIIGLAILSSILAYIPSFFAILWSLLLTSALFKYGFSCLKNTSSGNLVVPEISESFGGGFILALKLLLMLLVLLLVFWLSLYFLGLMFASLVGVLLIAIIPALLINFALSESVIEALNPQTLFRLISAVGLPYGLLLGFIMIMMASVGVINELIGGEFSLMTLILQSSVSNYYVLVIFHIMGYMIYQYHKELGLGNIVNNSVSKQRKSVLQQNINHIDVLIKSGELDQAIAIFKEIILSYPHEKLLKQQYFNLLLVTQSVQQLNLFAGDYLEYLLAENRAEQIPLTLKKIYKVSPHFKPNSAEQRHKLAKICAQVDDYALVIKLLNGLHRDFPAYENLPAAYELMLTVLQLMPNRQEQVQACENLIKRLSQRQS